MELTKDFRVGAPPSATWEVLTDVERMAPLLPGAQLQGIEGSDFHGLMEVEVGTLTVEYQGAATFEERNEADGRVVVRASGRDTSGQGNASAILTATLVPDGDGTKVTVVTDLTVTGKVAQSGRDALADVSSELLGRFVDALEAELRGDAPAQPLTGAGEVAAGTVAPAGPEDAAVTAGGPDSRTAAPAEPEPVDLLDATGGSAVTRLALVLGGIGVAVVVLVIGRSRRHR